MNANLDSFVSLAQVTLRRQEMPVLVLSTVLQELA